MAYGEKYYATTIDYFNIEWTLKILRDGFAGAATELRAARSGLRLIYEGENEDVFSSSILASRVECDLMVQDSGVEADLEAMVGESEDAWRCELWIGASLKWRGKLLIDTHNRARASYPYPVTLVATDGLARLRDIPFEDGGGNPYTGRETQLEIIVKILNKLGHELQFVTTDEWFESQMLSTQDDDPLAQAEIDQGIYWDSSSESSWMCYDVLIDILKRKSLQLLMVHGAWFLTQLTECAKSALIERRYNSDGTPYVVPSVIVDRSFEVDQVNAWIEAGGSDEIQKPVDSVSVGYNHGELDSYLNNGSFEYWEVGDLVPDGWTVVAGLGSIEKGTEHVTGNYSVRGLECLGSPGSPVDPDDLVRFTQETPFPIIRGNSDDTEMSLSFQAKYTLRDPPDPLTTKRAYWALTYGIYAIWKNGDQYEWFDNGGNPYWNEYAPTEDWTEFSFSFPAPLTTSKITALFTTIYEDPGFTVTPGCVDSIFVDDVLIESQAIPVPSTVRTKAILIDSLSTAGYDLGIVHHGDGPVIDAQSRLTIASGALDTVLWTERDSSSYVDLPLSELQVKKVASAQQSASLVLSATILGEFGATSILLVGAKRYIFRGGVFDLERAECQGVWQEIKDDQQGADIVVSYSDESGGAGGGAGGGGGGGTVTIDVLARFTEQATTIIAAVNKFHSNSWDGVLDGTGHISTPGTIGWIVAGGDDFEFIKGSDDYIRGSSSTLEIALTSELPIRRAKDTDALSIINPTDSTALIQQSSPWLLLTCHAWDTTTSGGMDTEVPWRIRNEAYASPGHGGGVLVFKVESQYIRRPFAIDEQGRMLLAYGSGPFSDQDTGPYYGFNGEDFGQWPIILAANIGGLNKVVVGWPENAITTDLYVTGKTYHYDAPIPNTNDLTSLGTTSNQWSDLFLASGGVINFANGNAAITHSTGAITLSTRTGIGLAPGAAAFYVNASLGRAQFINPTGDAYIGIGRSTAGADRYLMGFTGTGATGHGIISGGAYSFWFDLAGKGIGLNTIAAIDGMHVQSTSTQLRLACDASNFIDQLSDSTGGWIAKYKDGERILTLSPNNVSTNAFIGYQAGRTTATGGGNFGGGSGALFSITSGTYNLGFGHQALFSLTDATSNSGIGMYALLSNVHGNYNVGIGREAGYNCTTDAGVFIGFRAGYHETGAGKLFIDNAARASEADGRLKAMVYGVFNSTPSTQTITFNALATVQNDMGVDGFTVYNPTPATAIQQQHSPWLTLTCHAWNTDGAGSSEDVPWRIRSEGYASPGHGGGCLVFRVNAQYHRRPIAVDEQGRMILGYGAGPKAYEGDNIYGFAGEDFGAGGGAGTGNWPIILAADIAGLNRVVVGWPTESIVSDLYVTGKIAVSLLNGETLATSCTLSSGTGVPGAAEPNGSLYMRRDGAAGTSLYIRTSGAWVGVATGITSLNGLSGASQTFVNDTNVTIVSAGTTHTVTWSGTLAAARVGNLPASKITSGTFADSFLDTISTAGKVSGGAITSGTIGGSTIFNSSGAITTTGVLTVTGASYVRSVIVKNPTASTAGSQVQHSPYIELICQSWDTSNSRNDEVPWRLLNEAYASSGHGGGCLVFYTSSQYNRRPWAIDENGRGILGTGVGPYTINGETIYGFHGEDFGSYGNWPLILEGSIAGLNKVVVGSPPNDVTSDLYVTGVIYTMTSGARGTAHQVVGAQQAAIANATDAPSVIARLNDLLGACRTHGLIAT